VNRLLVAVLAVFLLIMPGAATADWVCDGDTMRADLIAGAVDPTGLSGGIPNTSDGTLPGDGVLLHWRELTLQLPRTNNAGVPSYTDGRWWWRVVDQDHPEFLERRGQVITHSCDPV